MRNINCWLCGNAMTYKGVINADILGKSHLWECGVCGEGVLKKVKPTLGYNCYGCGGEYKYLKDEKMEELGMVSFKCTTCGDEIAIPIKSPYLEGWKK